MANSIRATGASRHSCHELNCLLSDAKAAREFTSVVFWERIVRINPSSALPCRRHGRGP